MATSTNKLQHLSRLLKQRNSVLKFLSIRKHSNNESADNSDFFGIPEDYSLQHFRHSIPTETKTQNENGRAGFLSSSANLNENASTKHKNQLSKTRPKSNSDNLNLIEDYHTSKLKRRERRERRTNVNNYKTHFGVVKFDSAAVSDLKDQKQQTLYQSLQSKSNKQHNRNHRHSSKSNVFQDISESFGTPHVNQKTANDASTHSERIEGRTRHSSDSEKSDYHYNTSNVKRGALWLEDSSLNKSSGQIPNSTNSHFDIDSQYFQKSNGFLDVSQSNSIPITAANRDLNVNHADPKSFTHTSPSLNGKHPQESTLQTNDKMNLFDEYYFPDLSSESGSIPPGYESLSVKEIDKESEFNAIDDQYFGKDASSTGLNDFSDLVSSYNFNKEVQDESDVSKMLFSKIENEAEENSVVTNRGTLLKKKFKQKEKINQNEESTTAFDLAMKIRERMKSPNSSVEEIMRSPAGIPKPSSEDGITTTTKEQVDSKGFRILSDQVLNFYNMPSMDVVDILKKNIVFDHEDFLVIDKPYGLPSIGQVNDTFSLSSLLPALGAALPQKYKANDLHLIQGLDRDVTGNVILAKNPEVAYMLREKLKTNEIIQRYWAITKGVPNPRRGIINIPIGVGKVGNIYKMVLRPQYRNHEKPVDKKTSKSQSDKAMTEYNVLSSYLQCALVECCLQTSGVKHQIRVHLSSGLNTPILGDHKYSHFSKMAPQKLDRSTLELLRVRQAKVRHISLHLHCHSLVLPDYKSQTFVITSHLPSFFIKNMKSLKLSLPRK